MTNATVTFFKSDFMKPKKNGVSYSEECWDNFVSTMVEKFTAVEFSSVICYSNPERIECTVDVPDTVVADKCSMEVIHYEQV